jgi:hypothetical protein
MIRKKFKGLNPYNGNIKIKNIFGFDIETIGTKNNFYCVSIVGKDYSFFTYDINEFIKELHNYKLFQNSYICATNLAFDFFGIFSNFENTFKTFNIIDRAGSLIYAETYISRNKDDLNFYKNPQDKKHYVKLVFLDTFNYISFPVHELGKILNIPKLESPNCLGRLPINKQEQEELKIYNLRDSEITFKYMEFLQEQINNLGGSLQVTISSTALDIFRRKFLKSFLSQNKRSVINREYKSYYGGRTETFKRGFFNPSKYKKTIKSYDVNSLYPYVMKEFYFPFPSNAIEVKTLNTDLIHKYDGVGYFELIAPDFLDIPYLPVKLDKLLFPLGIIKGYYTFFDIRESLKIGYKIRSFGEGHYYKKKFRPFKDYVTDLYKLRMKFKKEKSKNEIVIKLLLNSLYGKFGFNYSNKETLFHFDNINKEIDKENSIIPTKHKNIYRSITNLNSFIPKYVFPILSAYVTSYARFVMYKHYRNVGIKHLYYTDTDCVFTDKTLNTSSELGQMKLENSFNKLVLIRPKFYIGTTQDRKDIIKIKGDNLAKHKTFNEIYQNIIDNDLLFKSNNKRFIKLRTALQDKYKINEVIQINKEMNLNDSKREWLKDFDMLPQESKPLNLTDFDYLNKSKRYFESSKDWIDNNIKEIDSDLLDIKSIGKDITIKEFIKNEIYFSKNNL